MVDSTQWVVLGRLGAPYGVLGWLMLNSFADPPEQIFTYLPEWHLADKEPVQATSAVVIEEHQAHAGRFRVKIQGIVDRTQAASFTHRLIVVPRAALIPPEAGQFYWADLRGLVVYNTQGQRLGVVDDLFDTGANDVLIIKDDTHRMHLAPYIPSVIQAVDLKNQRLTIEWEFLE